MKTALSTLAIIVVVLAFTSTKAMADTAKVYGSKIGATVLVSGSEEFINVVENSIKKSNVCNTFLNGELTEQTSNPPETKKFLAINQVGDMMIIRPSTGEFLVMPSKDVESLSRAFIDQEVQAKFRAMTGLN